MEDRSLFDLIDLLALGHRFGANRASRLARVVAVSGNRYLPGRRRRQQTANGNGIGNTQRSEYSRQINRTIMRHLSPRRRPSIGS
jgi:hypothetical protein